MDQNLIQLTEHIWLWPCSDDPEVIQPSIGVIAGKYRTILVDAGNSPYVVNRIKDAIQQARLPAVSSIVYTHHHWDHVYGACVFQVPVYAHEKCRSILLNEAKKPWSAKYLDQMVARNPKLKVSYDAQARAIHDWDAFQIVVPDKVFSTIEVFDLDGIRVELEHVGGKHARDSIIVKVPQDRVMFLGDCYYPPPLHLRKPSDVASSAMLKSIKNETYVLYVEGHDAPFS